MIIDSSNLLPALAVMFSLMLTWLVMYSIESVDH